MMIFYSDVKGVLDNRVKAMAMKDYSVRIGTVDECAEYVGKKLGVRHTVKENRQKLGKFIRRYKKETGNEVY